ncbi:MAG: hypothetical protein PHN59_00585 [Candidatus Omnitrophica bacterium]|nr:hypothetical protein [Candidatus Omnitrophota bacterium]
MKKIILLSAILLFSFSFSSVALAGDSASIPISITIPAIPGFNAPPYAAAADKSVKEKQQLQAKKETQKKSPKVIVEEKEQIQTVYLR